MRGWVNRGKKTGGSVDAHRHKFGVLGYVGAIEAWEGAVLGQDRGQREDRARTTAPEKVVV
jgi:hypothetical protein